jgi:anti-sigma B factor antagonist
VKIETLIRDGVATLVVSGDVDAAEKAAVGEAVKSLLDRGESRLVFDIENVTFLGSSGVSCLIAARRDAMAKSGGVALVNPPAMIRKVLHTLGFEDDFPVYRSRDDAAKALAGKGGTAGH